MKTGGIEHDMESRSLDIFFTGCKKVHRCKGCHNADLWDARKGKKFYVENTVELIKEAGSLIKHVRLMGGEPLDQKLVDLQCFLQRLKDEVPDVKRWVFTGYTTGFPDFFNQTVDFIKAGPYVDYESKSTIEDVPYFGNLDIASCNQCVIDVKDRQVYYASSRPTRKHSRKCKNTVQDDKTMKEYAESASTYAMKAILMAKV